MGRAAHFDARQGTSSYCEGMRACLLIMLMLATGCGQSASPATVAPVITAVPATATTTFLASSDHAVNLVANVPTAPRRCLPVVSQECGCVYKCGLGVQVGNGATWSVSHVFWPGMPLTARVVSWCVADKCTPAFAAELVCGGICAPKPADSTCHVDAVGACVGAANQLRFDKVSKLLVSLDQTRDVPVPSAPHSTGKSPAFNPPRVTRAGCLDHSFAVSG